MWRGPSRVVSRPAPAADGWCPGASAMPCAAKPTPRDAGCPPGTSRLTARSSSRSTTGKPLASMSTCLIQGLAAVNFASNTGVAPYTLAAKGRVDAAGATNSTPTGACTGFASGTSSLAQEEWTSPVSTITSLDAAARARCRRGPPLIRMSPAHRRLERSTSRDTGLHAMTGSERDTRYVLWLLSHFA